ncbi:RagB/SusD family nutrient uptake outer membrane protein [Bacteroides pyogenes]|uniref:RagB/SusD family nutrient uptake outer membrane protein n=1 Tax=Bacteroides pyogenes TaxID=310300 RepID=UPI0003DDB164|nr:RagB/SusD family nutrient uptake outer membrane protein [Bacteroides pyogenes]MBB3896368.1 hypothetical protein [Bacteroides pyogenes]GAE23694.1 hypothetical protein JCM10003_3506 [Bacteroides pyogenes JCM 10003]SUV31097.1 RagB/SusD domain protein [Bacteroides pyogenes]
MNTLKYIFCGLLVLSVTSCNDFLDREPLDRITPESYFLTADQLGTYVLTQYNFSAHFGNGYNLGIYRDDNDTDVQVSNEGRPSRWVPGIQTTPDGDGGWRFTEIYNCNYFFDEVLPKYASNSIHGNITDIKHYIGEMYMIRANAYFKCLKKFGDFPIIEHTIALNDKDALIKANERKPMTEVARFILSDLDKAIEFMEVNASDDSKRNRLTKEAAYMLKSRVALYVGSWLKYFQGTPFVPGGQGWPGAKKSYNKHVQLNIGEEIAFFLDESMAASKYIAEKIPLTVNNFSNYEEESNPYARMFADKDLSIYDEVIFWRAGHASSYKVGYGFAHTQGGSNTGYTRAYVNSFLMSDGTPIYHSTNYKGDETFEDVKLGRDNRLVQFMKIKDEPMSKLNNGEYVLFPEPQILTTAEYKSTTGYDIKKGLTMSVDDKIQNNQVAGVIEYRAVEAYLNYIEACYIRKGSIDPYADKYWKAIRKRAGVNDDYNHTIKMTDMKQESNLLSAYSAGKLVDETMFNIRRERACELMSEGFRWDDLRRWRSMDQLIKQPYQVEGFKLWGKMKEWYSNLHYDGESESTPNVSSPELSVYLRPFQIVKENNALYDGLKWTPANYLSPIGISQFTITSSIVSDITSSPLYQNPGWPTVAGGTAENVIGF